MELTFVNDLGHSFVVEIDPNMELENVMALLEAESGIPVSEQHISHEGRHLNDPKATIQQLGVTDKAMLLLRRTVANPAGAAVPQDDEMMRLQLLGDPTLMRELRETQPELAHAVEHEPARFSELLRLTKERQYEAELAQQREIASLNADPFDVEVPAEDRGSYQAASHLGEYGPRSGVFARELWEGHDALLNSIPVEVNGHKVKAFVDSGAQFTINRVLGQGVDLLFGLDMLKAHQACIDLEKNVLRIQGREVTFLSEHELPDKARDGEIPETVPSTSSASGSGQTQPTARFPGGGNALGGPPRSTPPRASASTSRHSEEYIRTIMDLGVTREVAISTLDAAEPPKKTLARPVTCTHRAERPTRVIEQTISKARKPTLSTSRLTISQDVRQARPCNRANSANFAEMMMKAANRMVASKEILLNNKLRKKPKNPLKLTEKSY
ncbi:hypothetical protein F5146DRAFT_1000505 [Armillaria mellea]|nr:hypothetical protein F5146DRAFT_1000505 [Armillaria mellea]